MEPNQNEQIKNIMFVIATILWGIIVGSAFRLLADLGIMEPFKINQVIFWL